MTDNSTVALLGHKLLVKTMSAVTPEGTIKRIRLDCNQANCCTFPRGLRLEGDEDSITKLLECVCPE